MDNNIQSDYLSSSFKEFGIELKVDPIRRKRTDTDDNVMGIFYEEQPLMWKLFKDEIKQTIESVKGTIDFLDVGTGSGFWAIVVAKNIGGHILAIDKSIRAYNINKINIAKNMVQVDLRLGPYSFESAQTMSVKAITLTPPYHIYPTHIENYIPQHARGGANGFEEFKSQLKIANHHLNEGGKIFFNQMCLGDTEPEFVNFIPDLIEGSPSIHYINIFPPMQTYEFLNEVYIGKFHDFIEKVSNQYPKVFYTDGVICKDWKGRLTSNTLEASEVPGRHWKDRIDLHREVANHSNTEGRNV